MELQPTWFKLREYVDEGFFEAAKAVYILTGWVRKNRVRPSKPPFVESLS
jgi:hypothetical protein